MSTADNVSENSTEAVSDYAVSEQSGSSVDSGGNVFAVKIRYLPQTIELVVYNMATTGNELSKIRLDARSTVDVVRKRIVDLFHEYTFNKVVDLKLLAVADGKSGEWTRVLPIYE